MGSVFREQWGYSFPEFIANLPLVTYHTLPSEITVTHYTLIPFGIGSKYPLTYSFNHQSEVVAMKVEQDFADVFAPGDILIIRRVAVSQEGLLDVYEAPRNKIKIKNKHGFIGEPHREETIDSCCEKIIGHIIEERCLSIVLP